MSQPWAMSVLATGKRRHHERPPLAPQVVRAESAVWADVLGLSYAFANFITAHSGEDALSRAIHTESKTTEIGLIHVQRSKSTSCAWFGSSTPESKAKLHSQLPNPWANRGITYNTEGRRIEAVVRICELRMIEDIEEFGSQLNTPFLWPAQRNGFGNGEVEVCLTWAVDNPGGAISEVGANTIRTDNRGRRETSTSKVTI